MELWWSDLDIAHKVFYAIAVATSTLLLVQLVLSLFGFDGDADGDFNTDADVDHGAGIGVLSIRTVTAFFTGFGWGGVAALESGMGLMLSVLVALFAGTVLMAGVFFLMRALYALRYSGTLDYRNAIGEVGTVYLPVPAAMTGQGQVEVQVQGRLRVVQALTSADRTLPNQSRVRVVDTVDQQTLLVEPLHQPSSSAEEDS